LCPFNQSNGRPRVIFGGPSARNGQAALVQVGGGGSSDRTRPTYAQATVRKYFFDNIRNLNTGALMDFERPPVPSHESMHGPARDSDLEMPPPRGATGLDQEVRREIRQCSL